MPTEAPPADGIRRTLMGYRWAPEAVEATCRVANLFPDKEFVITEHGVATDDDAERIDYIRDGLRKPSAHWYGDVARANYMPA